MSEQAPEVSFVVIAYNEAANVLQCIDSVLSQRGLPSCEVIVVDDASTDDTASLVERRAASDDRIRLVRHPDNKGRGAARRTGQDASRGPLVAFIDADIRLPTDWLARASRGLDQADSLSGVAVPDGDCAVLWRMFRPRPRPLPSTWPLTGNNVLIRRSALQQVGWPAERRRSEDNRMAAALQAAGIRVVTDATLQVEHHENKTYRRTFQHLWGTGYHSNEVLRDLRRVRLPDLVWLTWLVAVLAGVGLLAGGVLPWGWALAEMLGVSLVVDAGSMLQRFHLGPNPLRWVAALLANLPLLLAYLVARTIYTPRLLRHPTPGAAT